MSLADRASHRRLDCQKGEWPNRALPRRVSPEANRATHPLKKRDGLFGFPPPRHYRTSARAEVTASLELDDCATNKMSCARRLSGV